METYLSGILEKNIQSGRDYRTNAYAGRSFGWISLGGVKGIKEEEEEDVCVCVVRINGCRKCMWLGWVEIKELKGRNWKENNESSEGIESKRFQWQV